MTPIALYKAIGEKIEDFLEKKRPGQMNVEINFTPQGLGDCFVQEPREKLKANNQEGYYGHEFDLINNICKLCKLDRIDWLKNGGKCIKKPNN